MTYIDGARQRLQDELNERGVLFDDPVLLDLYLLLAHTHGPECTLLDVHDAWSIATSRNRPDHRSLVPFGDLSHEVQQLDEPYRDAIAATGRWLTS